MASRSAAVAVFGALRRPRRSWLSSSYASLGQDQSRGVLQDHQSGRQRSSIVRDCAPSESFVPSRTASRLFSADAAASASKVILLKDDAQYAEIMKDVKSEGTLVVAYFTAKWCGPCRQIAPYIDELSQQFDTVTFLKIDIDNLEVEQTVENSRIAVVPTFHFYKSGEHVSELTGAAKDKLGDLVESLSSKS